MSIRLAVFGLFGSPNLGNEATFAAFLHAMRVRLPDSEVVCVAPRQSRVAAMHGIDTVDMLPLPVAPWLWRLGESRWRTRAETLVLRATEGSRRRHARQALTGCAALVVPGTGVVDDFGQGPDDLPLHLDRWTRAAHDAGMPVHFVSIGVARVADPLSRARFGRALKVAASLSVRDADSAAQTDALGIPSSPAVMPDLAFSLPPRWLPAAPPIWPASTVGLGIMGYRGWNLTGAAAQEAYDRYLRRVIDLGRRLLRSGYRLRLLLGDTRADGAARDALAAALHAAAAAGDDSRRGSMMDGANFGMRGEVVTPRIENFKDLLVEIGLCDVVVATRYHNVLLALASGRPVVSIGYAEKNDALLADFGEQRFGYAIDDFDPEQVAGAVATLAACPSPYSALMAKATEFRARLDAQYDALVLAWRGAAD